MNRFHRWYCRTGHWRQIAQEQLLPWVLRGADLGAHALEVGPGPGLMTDVLKTRVPALTALEIDAALAAALRARHPEGNVTVIEGDGTAMPFADGTFTGAISCAFCTRTVAGLQNRLLAESPPRPAPGAWFVGSDSMTTSSRLTHLFGHMVLVDPDTFAGPSPGDAELHRGHQRARRRRWPLPLSPGRAQVLKRPSPAAAAAAPAKTLPQAALASGPRLRRTVAGTFASTRRSTN
jgi:SAM-dependent methyltransferase